MRVFCGPLCPSQARFSPRNSSSAGRGCPQAWGSEIDPPVATEPPGPQAIQPHTQLPACLPQTNASGSQPPSHPLGSGRQESARRNGCREGFTKRLLQGVGFPLLVEVSIGGFFGRLDGVCVVFPGAGGRRQERKGCLGHCPHRETTALCVSFHQFPRRPQPATGECG